MNTHTNKFHKERKGMQHSPTFNIDGTMLPLTFIKVRLMGT